MNNNLKMYIFVKKYLPSHKVVGVAHGLLMAHLVFKDRAEYKEWLTNSFRKVVCEVTDDEFNMLKNYKDSVIVTESSLDGKETAMVFCPRVKWPKIFKQLPLLKL
jgi:hypothetical protein